MSPVECFAQDEAPEHVRAWRRFYSASRYLEYLSQDQLKQHIRDLLSNLITVDRSGDLRLSQNIQVKGPWTERLVHVEEELRMRGLDMAIIQAEVDIIEGGAAFPRLHAAIQAWGDRAIRHGGSVWAKYGRAVDIHRLINVGSILLRQASHYEKVDREQAPGVFDAEMSRTQYAPPGTRIEFELNGEWHELPVGGLITHTATVPDYYLYCVSAQFDPRAFDAFDCHYDACLLIHDPIQFAERLKSAMRTLYPNYVVSQECVTYVDPYWPINKPDNIRFAKSIAYSYQSEIRFVWEVPDTDDSTRLSPIDIEIGCLKDFCEAIRL